MFGKKKARWADEADVVVVGSGAAGMTAALSAHDAGAKVLVLERTGHIGGTTAVSGGGIWIPLNSKMAATAAPDSRADAVSYCKALTMGRAQDAMIETFVDNAAPMIEYLEHNTPLRFDLIAAPDYHPEAPGGRTIGRSIEPKPFDTNLLGNARSLLRQPSAMAFPGTLQEIFGTYQAFYRPWEIPQELVAERMSKGIATLGQALAAGLFRALLDRSIMPLRNKRVRTLLQEDDRIVGVAFGDDVEQLNIRARRAVILATSGFEWNRDLCLKFLGGPPLSPNSPPFNEGDGLLMAMEAGAELANMNELWHYPSIRIDGEIYEGHPMSRAIKAERSGPHVIWVNAKGRRFVNEAANYNSVGKSFFALDANKPSFENFPAWAIFDRQYRERYVAGTAMPDDPDPPYLIKAESLEDLAAAAGIAFPALRDTIDRWNGFVLTGRDNDFGRGDSAFDQFQGDRKASHPNLGTIEKSPFYALPLYPGALGTKGGPVTNVHGQVMHVRGHPIPGLYAAGNVAASITGPSYYGVGSTLGPAMTWGYLAGKHAAQSSH